jgi:carbon monoxide dehydrogenase subunit G
VIEVNGERYIDAKCEQVWLFVEDVKRMPDWLSFAQTAELLEGEGVGRRQRVGCRWGSKLAQIDQVVVDYQPGRLLAWSHESEIVDGRPAPRFADTTVFTIRLIPDGGGTRVRLESKQEPAGPVRAVAIRLFGCRAVAKHIDRSLDRLECRLMGRQQPSGRA